MPVTGKLHQDAEAEKALLEEGDQLTNYG